MAFSKYLIAAIWGITKEVTYVLTILLGEEERKIYIIDKKSITRKAGSEVSWVCWVSLRTVPPFI